MAAFVEAIGVISGLLGIVSFAQDNFGSGETSGSTYKFAVALDGPGGTTNAGGDLPDVRVWNDVGKFVGMSVDPGKVKNGNLGEYSVDHENQGVYSLFSANDDAICVAWVTTTWSDDRGGNQYAVSGDYGEACGGVWFESHMYPNADEEYQPKCFWIDANGDQPQTGFQVRWPAFSKDSFDENDTDPHRLCNGIDFGLREEEDPNSITYRTSKDRRNKLRVRQPPRRPAWADSEIVISDAKQHSAKRLCQSDTSMGPDFAHTGEELFCDMDTKTLYAFCQVHDTETCFDLDSQSLLTPKHTQSNSTMGGNLRLATVHAAHLAAAPASASKSKYSSTRDWRSTSKKA
ncbi:uncharacterized protein KD926_006931 [Aspergillus affinis]|uniref:uncharacterized protein n=1 Tax=Aspergillus affinis TaxID=1070780 RepID=UPI0022FDE073|nr:uncharacterized protein KD926_006931 [Aspergillus affinis]KAI9041355.1 hypothetical protein KD926_006931 [Aspergillus affinis]